MGSIRIVIEMDPVPHGCERSRGNGETVHGCRKMDCPDCMVRELLESMKAKFGDGCVKKALLVHWPSVIPGQPSDLDKGNVVDDLATKTRHGSFKP